MAEGIWKQQSNRAWDVESAGSDPVGHVHPLAIEAMHEIGVDISANKSKHANRFRDERFDLVVTVCDHAAQNCPVFPHAKQTVHWPFDDPSFIEGTDEDKLNAFCNTRDEIATRIQEYLIVFHSGCSSKNDSDF